MKNDNGTEKLLDEITALKRVMSKQRSEIFQLRNIIDHLPGDVYWKDVNGVWSGVNSTGSEHLRRMGFQWNSSDVVGKTDYDLFEKETADEFRKNDLEIMQTGVPRMSEESATLPSGEKIVQLSTKRPLYDEDGKVAGIVGVSVNITAQKMLEQELMATKANEERLKALSAMGGMIAHELRTPLAAMGVGVLSLENYLPILIQVYREWSAEKKQFPISPLHASHLEKMGQRLSMSVTQMGNTIDTVLAAFCPMDTDASRLVSIELASLIQECLSQYPLTQEEAQLIKVKECDGTVLGSPNVVSQVLVNLIKNALFFIKEVGKGEITLWTSQEAEGKVALHIKDTAKGIPKDKLQQIFEPFYTTKSAATSIGMGLYFSKMALEKTGASIHCVSSLGQYAEFTILFSRVDKGRKT